MRGSKAGLTSAKQLARSRLHLWGTLASQVGDPASGIRDAEAVDDLANQAGLTLENDYEMPANNRMRVWRKAG